jgi:hypothetical protein
MGHSQVTSPEDLAAVASVSRFSVEVLPMTGSKPAKPIRNTDKIKQIMVFILSPPFAGETLVSPSIQKVDQITSIMD